MVIKVMGILGVSLFFCSVFGFKFIFEFLVDEVELGLGIYGEVGVCWIKMVIVDEIVKFMFDYMINIINVFYVFV